MRFPFLNRKKKPMKAFATALEYFTWYYKRREVWCKNWAEHIKRETEKHAAGLEFRMNKVRQRTLKRNGIINNPRFR